jgi:hypothetical protein
MKYWLAVVGFIALAACGRRAGQTGAFLDPTLATLIPPDTNLLVTTHVEELVKTPLYREYLDGHIPAIEKFSARTGVDPTKRLWSIVFLSNGRRGLLLGRGKFADELMAPDFSREGVKRMGYKGLNLYGDEQQAMLVLNSSTVAIGATPDLQAFADRRTSFSGVPPAIASKMREIPHQAQIWGVYTGGPVDVPLSGNAGNVNRALDLAQSGRFYFDLSSGIKGVASATAASAVNAQQLHDALEGFLALGRMAAPKGQTEFSQALDGLRVTQQGQTVDIQVDEPQELAGKLIRMWVR